MASMNETLTAVRLQDRKEESEATCTAARHPVLHPAGDQHLCFCNDQKLVKIPTTQITLGFLFQAEIN